MAEHRADIIKNDVGLLEQMMADLSAYQGPLGPGPYWLKNQRATVEWLRHQDLNGFRRYIPEGKGLSNFGGGSHWRAPGRVAEEMRALSSSVVYRAAQKLRLSSLSSQYARRNRLLSTESNLAVNATTWLSELCQARDPAKLLARLEVGREGDPADLIVFNGRHYTPMFLMKFLIYLDILKLAGPLDIKSYVEIGPGAGRLAEIVARLHPSARLYLVDIAPQLYVTHQVLHAIFPGEVAPYREVGVDPRVLSHGPFRIFVLAPWQFERLELPHADLAVCEATEEMPKPALQGYFGHLHRLGVRNLFVRTALSKAGYDMATPDELLAWLPGFSLARKEAVNDENSPRVFSGESQKLAGNPAVQLLFKRTLP